MTEKEIIEIIKKEITKKEITKKEMTEKEVTDKRMTDKINKKRNRTGKKAAAAIAVTAAMLIITGLAAGSDGMNPTYLCAGFVLSLAAGFFVMLDLRYGWMISLLLYLLFPYAALWALEHYTHVIQDLEPMILILNLLFWYIIYGIGIFLTGSFRVGCAAATCIPMLWGLANYFVVQFRGTPIVPWDLLSIGTAMSVADNYEFSVAWKTAGSLFVFLWIILLASKSSVQMRSWKVRLAPLLAFLLLLGGYVTQIQKPEIQKFFGMDTTLFTLNVLYRNNGIAGAFLGNLRFLNLEEPDGYSVQKAEELARRTEERAAEQSDADGQEEALIVETEAGGVFAQPLLQNYQTEQDDLHDAKASEVSQYPNVIVIMNEAFSDLSVWGEYDTSEEVMPFFRSLQKEGIGGELYVSVKGGNTANTEFEFLTGNTMGFLPAGSVPYQQYLNEKTPSLASHLKGLGYSTLAIHPYNRSGWDRDEVYEYFGFDEFLDRNAFDNPYRMRGYVSDSSAFEKIIEQFQLKRSEERMFVFEVTMQNHGGYSKDTPDFRSHITLPEVENKTTSVRATEKYLSLMNHSDRALKELITYFEQQEEPVVVLMMGDHQPSDYITNTVKRFCGTVTGDSLEEMQQGYRVPFMIWSNQDLEPKYYDGISVNYLGGILMEAAGIPLTGYQEYLMQLMETLPVVSGLAYRDREGSFYSLDDDTYADTLNEYKILQYNHLVDTKNRMESFFGAQY